MEDKGEAIYSSEAGDYVDKDDPAFAKFLKAGGIPGRQESEDTLQEYLAERAPDRAPRPLPAPRDLSADVDALQARAVRAEALLAVALEKGLVTDAEVDAKVVEADKSAMAGA